MSCRFPRRSSPDHIIGPHCRALSAQSTPLRGGVVASIQGDVRLWKRRLKPGQSGLVGSTRNARIRSSGNGQRVWKKNSLRTHKERSESYSATEKELLN